MPFKLSWATTCINKVLSDYDKPCFDFQEENWLKEEMEELGQILSMQNSENKQPDIRDILTNKGMRKHTLALFFIW